MTKTKIAVILGSSRTNGNGKRLFNYLVSQREKWEKDFSVVLQMVKVSEFDLPFFDQDEAPMNNPAWEKTENEARWVDLFKEANGFVFVTPEYNHSLPGVLKNALDYIAFEGRRKPAKIISYSDNSGGGIFAAAELVPVLNRLGMIVLPFPTSIRNVDTTYRADGSFEPEAKYKDRDIRVLNGAMQEISFYSKVFQENQFKK